MDLTTSPFKALREATGLTPAEFIREAAIARTTGVYLEAGLFLVPRATEVLDRLLVGSEAADEIIERYDSETLETATTLWQKQVRQSHLTAIVGAYNEPWERDDIDPFTEFAERAFGNRDAFCKAMKVQTGPIKLWLESSRSMPAILMEALLDGGLTQKQVTWLGREVQDWKERHLVGSDA